MPLAKAVRSDRGEASPLGYSGLGLIAVWRLKLRSPLVALGDIVVVVVALWIARAPPGAAMLTATRAG